MTKQDLPFRLGTDKAVRSIIIKSRYCFCIVLNNNLCDLYLDLKIIKVKFGKISYTLISRL